jgi:transcription elongation factor GreA
MSSRQITLGQALAEYLQTLKPDVRRSHEQPIRRFVEYHAESTLVTSLSGSHVERYAEQQISIADPAAAERVQALKAWFVYLKKREYTEANLGVHIRARRAQASRTSSGPRVDETPVEMTRGGFEALQEELQDLERQRTELRQAVEHARSDGDLRENAPYHAAREALALVENRIRQIEESLRRATIVERPTGDRATVGSIVRVVNLDDEKTFEYRLVSPREANAAEKKISVESPVGRELLGRAPGDEVVVATPRGQVRFRIEAVAAV